MSTPLEVELDLMKRRLLRLENQNQALKVHLQQTLGLLHAASTALADHTTMRKCQDLITTLESIKPFQLDR